MKGVGVVVVSCLACGGSSHQQPDGAADAPADAPVDVPSDAPVGRVECATAMVPRIAVDGYPSGVAIADVDHDGLPDLLVVLSDPAALDVMLGHGDGTFGAATRIMLPADSGPIAPAVGDIDGDGDLDIVLALQGVAPDGVQLVLNDGHGTFTLGARLPAAGASSIALGDLDGDGTIDIVSGNAATGGGVQILLGTGGGAFGTPHAIDTTVFYDGLALADVDGDHQLDLVGVGAVGAAVGYSQLAVFHGNGDGTFASPFTAPLLENYAQQVVVGDLNGDSVPDIVTAGAFVPDQAMYVETWVGSGTGTFTKAGEGYRGADHRSDYPPPNEFHGRFPDMPAVADFDGDGKLDIAVMNENNLVGVIAGTGTGAIDAVTEYEISSQPSQIAIGDLDHDGRPDVVAVDDDRYIEVMLGSDRGLRAPRSIIGTLPGYGYQLQSAAGDIDGDGALDFALGVSVRDSLEMIDQIYVVRSATPGLTLLLPPDEPWFLDEPLEDSLALTDVDGDGKLDVVLSSNRVTTGWLSVWRNDANGGFAPRADHSIGLSHDLAIGDLDGDHRPELVVVTTPFNESALTATVFANDGTGTFTAGTPFPSQVRVQLHDLNDDGKLDLITNGSDTKITVQLGNGDRTFQPPIDTPTGVAIGRVAIADVDGNGVPDLVADTLVLLGNGDGTFTAGGTLPAPPGDLLAVADLDHVPPLDLVGTRGAIYRAGATTTTIEWPIVATRVLDTGDIVGSVRLGVGVYVIQSQCR